MDRSQDLLFGQEAPLPVGVLGIHAPQGVEIHVRAPEGIRAVGDADTTHTTQLRQIHIGVIRNVRRQIACIEHASALEVVWNKKRTKLLRIAHWRVVRDNRFGIGVQTTGPHHPTPELGAVHTFHLAPVIDEFHDPFGSHVVHISRFLFLVPHDLRPNQGVAGINVWERETGYVVYHFPAVGRELDLA